MTHGEHSTPGPLHLLSIYLESFSLTLTGSLCSPPLRRLRCTWSGTFLQAHPCPASFPHGVAWTWHCPDLASGRVSTVHQLSPFIRTKASR